MPSYCCSISLHCSPIQFSLAFFMLLLMLLFTSLYFAAPSGSNLFFLNNAWIRHACKHFCLLYCLDCHFTHREWDRHKVPIVVWSNFQFTEHGNLHPAEWPILFCGPTKEPVLATANAGKNQERLWKKCRWMNWKGRNKEEIPGSKHSKYGYILTYSKL